MTSSASVKRSRSLLVLLSASLLLIDAIGAFSGFPVMDDGEVLTILREGGLSALGPTHRDRPIYGARRGVKMQAELPDRETNDYLFALILPDARRREAFLAFLKTRGVMATRPADSSPFWQRYAGGSPSLPVTDRVAAALVRLPLHPRLTEEDLDRVVSAPRTVVAGVPARPLRTME